MSRRIRLALVDDDPSVRRALQRLLRSAGCEVDVYSSVGAFLNGGATDRLDCALVDVRMPGETGLALVEALRKQGIAMPVILMTGDADPGLSERVARLGAFALISKPVSDAVILEIIEDAASQRAAATAGRSGP